MDVEMIDTIQSFITEAFLIVIPILYIIGYTIKKTEYVSDKHIPLILIGIGVVLSVASGGFNVDAIFQGFLTGGATIGLNEVIKQSKKDE